MQGGYASSYWAINVYGRGGGTTNTISEKRGLNPENRRSEWSDERIKSIHYCIVLFE